MKSPLWLCIKAHLHLKLPSQIKYIFCCCGLFVISAVSIPCMAKFHVLNTAGKSTTKSRKEKQIILFSYASNDVLLFPASETLPELHLFFKSTAHCKTQNKHAGISEDRYCGYSTGADMGCKAACICTATLGKLKQLVWKTIRLVISVFMLKHTEKHNF